MKLNLLSYIFVALVFEWAQASPCESNIFSKTRNHLDCMAKSDLSQSLSQGLKTYLELKNQCSDCKAPFLGAEEFAYLFGEKHLVVAQTKNDFGGMNLFVIFKKSAFLFKFWIYEIENYKGEIRHVTATKPTKEMAATIQYLQRQSSFWRN